MSRQANDQLYLFESLLHAETESEVDRVLHEAGLSLENEAVWKPLGNMENNFSTVGNQQTEATAALVEKLINGIDAVLMSECFRAGVEPEGPDAPLSMAEAVQRFFSVRDGSLGNLDAKRRTDLADKLQLIAVGDKSAPNYLIIDQGEGQSPDQFPDTFLSLNKSNKLRIPFVQGKFNSGGTGVLQFCGTKNIQLIASKRDPRAPLPPQDTSRDQWGFTVVRRMKPSEGRKNSMYVYLAPNGNVPRFECESLMVLPQARRSIAPNAYSTGLKHGTCVKLYDFRWKARSIATTEARYELERFLHSPCLPFRITETRAYRANYFSTTVSGVWATIGSDDNMEDTKVEPNFPAYADMALTEIGRLPYRIAVFRDTVDSRHVPHGVYFTVNGQVHGSLPSDFVARHLKFDYLKDHLLVSVDCTAMNPTVREDFFMASRDRVRKNEIYERVVEHLKAELRDHAGLRQLNAARRKKEIEETLSDESETKNIFNELLKADPSLANLFGLGDRLITKLGPGAPKPFVGRKFPSYFRLTKNPDGGLVKRCPVNKTCRLEFETDAVNDYFRRADSPGAILIDPPNLIEHSNLWNGRFGIQIRAPWDAKPGDKIAVRIVVEDIETQTRQSPFVSEFVFQCEVEEDRRPGGARGEKRGGNGNTNGSNESTSLAIPELKWIDMSDIQASLRIRHDDAGNNEYFVNLQNQFLTAELIKAKDEDKPLVKFWFGYGLLLCALGMLKTHENGVVRQGAATHESESEESDEDNSARVSSYCNGIARVIVPIIRTLYRGPLAMGGN